MFIVWGQKTVRRKLGYAADYCSICRAVTPQVVHRLGSAGHLYYITISEGRLIGHERTCCECGATEQVNIAKYRDLCKKSGVLAELIEKTHPDVAVEYANAMAFADRLRHHPDSLSVDERNQCILLALKIVTPDVERRFAHSTYIDRWSGMALILSLILLNIAGGIHDTYGDLFQRNVLGVTFVFCLLLILSQFLLAPGRYMKKHVYPILVRSLSDLEPTEGEITAILTQLKMQGFKIGRKLKAAQLCKVLSKGRTTYPPSREGIPPMAHFDSSGARDH